MGMSAGVFLEAYLEVGSSFRNQKYRIQCFGVLGTDRGGPGNSGMHIYRPNRMDPKVLGIQEGCTCGPGVSTWK